MTVAKSYDQRVKAPDLSGVRDFSPLPPSGGIVIPNLASGSRKALYPHFDLLNLNTNEFGVMTRSAPIPSTDLFTRDPDRGLRGPSKEVDQLWGLANEPGVRVMLSLASCIRPRRSLVIGSGTGLLVVFLAAVAAQNGEIDAVDLSYQSSNLGDAVVTVPPADLDYIPQNAALKAGYYISYARAQGIRPDVVIHEHGADSTRFFQKRAASLDSEGYDLIIVDGAHTYAQAKVDITYSWASLRPGGILIVDDFDKAHVLGLEAVSVALHPILNDGYIVFFVGQDERGMKTEVAFAVNDPATRRPGHNSQVKEALAQAAEYGRSLKR